ncbi:MAG: lipoprotein-releasing system ATP-binding protein [Verrucomicrobiales bacterium]|jgi:lipoprotein-releasing system ATP-binding protein
MIVEITQVSKTFADSDGGPTRDVLSDLDFSLDAGESVAIIGSSGSGKSTLLNIIGTLDLADTGAVQLFGNNIAGADDAALSKLRSSEIGFIFQLHHLLPQCSVLENVLVPTLALGKSDRNASSERARKLLKRVGLDGHENKRPAQLSGGERQRVAVVRALINQPKLLLADEPTGALDAENARNLIDLLVELNQEEAVGVVMVTHDKALAARMGRILLLEGGKLTEG